MYTHIHTYVHIVDQIGTALFITFFSASDALYSLLYHR